MSYSEWMKGTVAVIDERAAMIATAVVVVVGLIIVAVRHREVLFGRKNASKQLSNMQQANKPLGGKASGQ